MEPVSGGLYLITDGGGNEGSRIETGVRQALDGGLRLLQLREKRMETGDLYRLAEKLRELTARYGAHLVVNERVDVALAAGADGVHVGFHGIPADAARSLGPRPFLVGVSAHSAEELGAAEAAEADFVTFGPVYETPSKRGYGPPLGLEALKAAASRAMIPVFALGGITKERVVPAREAGAAGVALISAIWSADNITRETREFVRLLSPGERT